MIPAPGINPTTLISLGGLAIASLSLVLSRTVTRRVRVGVHRAMFANSDSECYFVSVTNLSLTREVEITHVWFACPVEVHIIRAERPLPKRLKADETWATWIGTENLPTGMKEAEAFTLARVRLSTGKVFRSKQNKGVPACGSVPGGELPSAGSGSLGDPIQVSTLHSQHHQANLAGILPAHQSSGDNDPLFIKPFLWKGHTVHRCSVCEFDNEDRGKVEEHIKHNHGFAVGEYRSSDALNLLVANMSATSLLESFRLVLTQFRKWDEGLKQIHTVYELRDFRPIELLGGYTPIYAGKPAVFAFLDARDPAAPIIQSLTEHPDSVGWPLPGPGIWRADFEMHFGMEKRVRFYKFLAWDGTSSPKFIPGP